MLQGGRQEQTNGGLVAEWSGWGASGALPCVSVQCPGTWPPLEGSLLHTQAGLWDGGT